MIVAVCPISRIDPDERFSRSYCSASRTAAPPVPRWIAQIALGRMEVQTVGSRSFAAVTELIRCNTTAARDARRALQAFRNRSITIQMIVDRWHRATSTLIFQTIIRHGPNEALLSKEQPDPLPRAKDKEQ